jgi:hypothetical protein
MLVSAGFFAGLLLSAAFFRGTPPPHAASQSARSSDALPEIASPDRRERPADADAAAPVEAPPLASPVAELPAIVSSTNATRTGSAPADARGSTPAQLAAPATQAAARQPGTAAPGDSPEPQTRTARTVSETNDPADLSGAWLVTNRVDSTSYRAFQNLRIGYRLRLTQRGNRIVGEGRKWVEDGQALPQSRRTPIAVEGTLDGRWLELRFVESGARRASAGAFVMLVVDERTLQGTFTSNAANSSGSAVATRDTGKGL